MKTIEEKAKAYDEALKAAIAAHKDEDRHLKATLERIFPELQESEDERIRKGLIKALSSIGKRNWGGIDVFESISWLEKQGKQKETLCDKCKKTQPSHSCQDITALGRCALEKQGEQKLTEFEKAVKQVMEEAIECGDTHNLKADADMLLRLVHNSSWSEEDNDMLGKVIHRIEQLDHYWNKPTDEKMINWLKSLRPQSQWKPSEEQLHILEAVIADYAEQGLSYTKDSLNDLYEQLNKL